jgi:hypothetical protein
MHMGVNHTVYVHTSGEVFHGLLLLQDQGPWIVIVIYAIIDSNRGGAKVGDDGIDQSMMQQSSQIIQ